MQNRAIKYRIYPSAEQKILFAKTFGCCRKIWNLMLADKITYYQQTKKMLQTTPAQYKKAYPYQNRRYALTGSIKNNRIVGLERAERKRLRRFWENCQFAV